MPSILCAMRMPPNLEGHGGSQRAWRLLEALRSQGEVDFLLLHRAMDRDCMETSLDGIEPLVRSVTRMNLAGWQGTLKRPLGIVPSKVCDMWRMRSHEAPRLRRRELATIGDALKRRDYDVVFAARLPVAVILDDMMRAGMLSAKLRVIDFDDVMSKFRTRQAGGADASLNTGRRVLARIDARIISAAERYIARSWDGCSVCTEDDVASLAATGTAAALAKVPNVVERQRLAPRPPDGEFRVLFVGNLGFAPNSDGLGRFIDEAWPRVVRSTPSARLVIVGLHPPAWLHALAKERGYELHANVPSLAPFYAGADAVIAPILFGSGTRIKILEAMAYGRPVVSTSLGAEGLDLVDGRDVLLADDMPRFADAVSLLASDRAHAHAIADAAHQLQQRCYTPQKMQAAVADWLERSRTHAERRAPAFVPQEAASGRAT